jgi:hypothetical protein
LRRNGQAATVNGLKDFIGAAAEQRLANGIPERFGIIEVSVARFTQEFRAVGIGDNRIEVEVNPSG